MDSQGNIVIVDDNPNNLQVLSHILEAAGYKVRPALTAAIALRSIESLPADLILLDVCMPEMDGFEACRQLKKSPCAVDLPVIFISALNNIEDKLTAFQVGGVDYILKPFHADEILVRVKAHIKQAQSRRQLMHLLALRDVALQSSDARYRALLNDNPVAVMMYDADTWHVLEVNSAYAKLTANPAASFSGKSLEFALGSGQAAQLRGLTEQLLQQTRSQIDATAVSSHSDLNVALSASMCLQITQQAAPLELDAVIKVFDYPASHVCMLTLHANTETALPIIN